MRVAVLCSSSSCAALCVGFACVWRCVYTKSVRRARPGCLAASKTLAKGHIYGASYPRRSRVVFLLLDAAARRSGHARALGVVVVVVVDLLRAVLADLHEEGIELREKSEARRLAVRQLWFDEASSVGKQRRLRTYFLFPIWQGTCAKTPCPLLVSYTIALQTIEEVRCYERSGPRPPPMNRRRAVSPPQGLRPLVLAP